MNWQTNDGGRDAPVYTKEELEMRALLRDFGGSTHGPNVETVSMPETKFFDLVQELRHLAPSKPKKTESDICIRGKFSTLAEAQKLAAELFCVPLLPIVKMLVKSISIFVPPKPKILA